MSIQGTRFYTTPITEAITISAADGVIQTTLTVVSGTCEILGNFLFQGNQSQAITLAAGTSLTLSGSSPGGPIDGLTITPSDGTTNIIMYF